MASLGYLPDVETLKFLFPNAKLSAVREYEGATDTTEWPVGGSTVLPPHREVSEGEAAPNPLEGDGGDS